MKNIGFRVDILKVDGNRHNLEFRTHQKRFITSQREPLKISTTQKATETDMANPMDTEQFRVAAKAAIDESEYLSLFLYISLLQSNIRLMSELKSANSCQLL